MLVRAAHTAILCAFITVNAHGKNTPPKMRRVCLDRINSTATLYWTAPVDTCSTFLGYRIWGRDDLNGTFVPMGDESQKNTLSKTISIPNLKRWQFFLVASYKCGLRDSLVSDTLLVDDSEPVPMELDSVSVDISTQRIIAGWQKNGSPDLQGYLLYKVGASNQIIADTNKTYYLFSTLNPRVSGNRIAISAYDSCLQAGLISSYHEPILLNITDSNYCKREFSFKFTPYVGWSASRYEVFLKDQFSNSYKRYAVVSNMGPFSFKITTLARNTKYQCFIRAYHNNGLITSSSNLLSFAFDSLPSHTYSYIRRVTQKDDNLLVSAIFDNPNGSIKEAYLDVSENRSTWNKIQSASTSPLLLTTPHVPGTIKYYRLVLKDQCDNNILTSNTSNNIVLKKSTGSDFAYYWNNYANWPMGVREYQILAGYNYENVSTWNIFTTFPTQPTEFKLPDNFPKDKCLCIRAIENGPNNLGFVDTSYSNVLCPFELSNVYIPTAFTPNQDGKNETFSAISPALDLERTTMHIYNKWGSKVFEGNLKGGWNAYDMNNTKCPFGVYVYVINAVSKNSERKMFQGTVTLIY